MIFEDPPTPFPEPEPRTTPKLTTEQQQQAERCALQLLSCDDDMLGAVICQSHRGDPDGPFWEEVAYQMRSTFWGFVNEYLHGPIFTKTWRKYLLDIAENNLIPTTTEDDK